MAERLAIAGDVIRVDEPFPSNVVLMYDADGDQWQRSGTAPLTYRWPGRNFEMATDRPVAWLAARPHWWPMVVEQVDPPAAEPHRVRGAR